MPIAPPSLITVTESVSVYFPADETSAEQAETFGSRC